MEIAPQPFSVATRATVSNAKQAYLEGDFERCLEICSNIRVGSLATASEVALLTARALLRTGRPVEAQHAIVNVLDTHVTLDASLTAQLLVATARIRQDDADAGLAILADAASRSDGAHFTVRSEIALCTAIGYWEKREIDAAETCLAQVDPRSEIIYARALELQAWCHTARRAYRLSADAFRATLVALDACAVPDRALAATAISTLAMLAAELFDADLARFVEARGQRMQWSAELAIQHYLTLAHQALFYEFAGETLAAYQFAARAREVAPTVPFEAFGWSISSAIARNAGEAISAIVFAKRAQQLVETLDARELVGEERFVLLSAAETCAPFDPEGAAKLFARYWGPAPAETRLELRGDPRLRADETFIAGVVAQAGGELERARTCYRKAFEIFDEIGYVRRAITSAHALFELAAQDDLRRYMSCRLSGTRNYVTKALAPRAASDPLGSSVASPGPSIAPSPRRYRERRQKFSS